MRWGWRSSCCRRSFITGGYQRATQDEVPDGRASPFVPTSNNKAERVGTTDPIFFEGRGNNVIGQFGLLASYLENLEGVIQQHPDYSEEKIE